MKKPKFEIKEILRGVLVTLMGGALMVLALTTVMTAVFVSAHIAMYAVGKIVGLLQPYLY